MSVLPLAPVGAAPSPRLTVAAGDVTVHLVDLGQADAAALALAEETLTADERTRARRGTPQVHRRRVLLRAALRRVVAVELGVAPRSVVLESTSAGRPAVTGEPELDVSCSASGDLGLVAVGRRFRVGIDVERIVPWSADVLDEGWLSPAEQRALRDLPRWVRAEAATRSWTQKEAVLKACGAGLLAPLAAVETLPGRRSATLAGWDLSDVPVPDDRVATVATRLHQELPS